jgi:hypothetical protein
VPGIVKGNHALLTLLNAASRWPYKAGRSDAPQQTSVLDTDRRTKVG